MNYGAETHISQLTSRDPRTISAHLIIPVALTAAAPRLFLASVTVALAPQCQQLHRVASHLPDVDHSANESPQYRPLCSATMFSFIYLSLIFNSCIVHLFWNHTLPFLFVSYLTFFSKKNVLFVKSWTTLALKAKALFLVF